MNETQFREFGKVNFNLDLSLKPVYDINKTIPMTFLSNQNS